MDTQEQESKADFFVGQKGEFLLLDSFRNPIEIVKGKILQVMEGKNAKSIYVIILTERGIRPARLS